MVTSSGNILGVQYRSQETIGKHINNDLREKLLVLSTVAKFAIVQLEGGRSVSRVIEYYNLDVIISVGYRVKSKEDTQYPPYLT